MVKYLACMHFEYACIWHSVHRSLIDTHFTIICALVEQLSMNMRLVPLGKDLCMSGWGAVVT